MLTLILVNGFGLLAFAFLVWKRLKEDYSGQQIFTSVIYLALGFFIFCFVAMRIIYPYWFWVGMVGLVLSGALGIWRFHLKTYELVEAVVIGFLVWLAIIFLTDSVINSSLFSFINFALLVGLSGFFYFLDNHYRTFAWYRSGKIGFAGLMSAGLFFLVRGIFAGLYPTVLSFANHFEVYFSAIASFIFFLLTYNLSRTRL